MNIEDKKVIEREANIWYKENISKYQYYVPLSSIQLFKLIKERLIDFYLPESKVLFLQTIRDLVNNYLEKHKLKCEKKNCYEEKRYGVLLYSIKQEIGKLPSFSINQHLDDILINAKTKN